LNLSSLSDLFIHKHLWSTHYLLRVLKVLQYEGARAQNRRESSPFHAPDKLDAYVLPSFSLISFTCTFPWNAIGSLVSYFTDTYGPSYVVIINPTSRGSR